MKHLHRSLSVVALAFALLVSVLSSASFSFSPGQASAASEYAQRRDRVAAAIGENVAVILGAESMRAYVPFRQSNEFYYLTGIHDTADCILIVDGKTKQSVLLLPPFDRHYEQWQGHRLAPGKEAEEKTGVQATALVSEFSSRLASVLDGRKVIFAPQAPEELSEMSRDLAEGYYAARVAKPWDGRSSREAALKKFLEDRKYEVKNLSPILDAMRRVKSPEEIALMRRSCEVGAQGLIAAIRVCRPGMYEYQLGAIAEGEFKKAGAFGGSYFAIVGTGPNSCVLHYSALSRQMAKDDIIVMDFAPDYWYYASDITRTFPANGKFTQEQAKVYDVCLRAQKAAIEAVKPGATIAQVNAAARAVIEQAGLGQYWVHGVSHYVGMAVHDVGDYSKPLEPGVTITVEPGIYMPKSEIGVRIEDVVLVTASGHEVLSKSMPKERSEIEKLMAVNETGARGTGH